MCYDYRIIETLSQNTNHVQYAMRHNETGGGTGGYGVCVLMVALGRWCPPDYI